MKKRNYRALGMGAVTLLWAVLAVCAWFAPAKQLSEAERRPLAQMPAVSAQNLLGGKFMKDFEQYSLDQFPLRDSFRTIKSLFHFYGLQQKDNNNIFIANGYAVKQEYPRNDASISHVLERFQHLYNKYLSDTRGNIHMAIIPDKGYYLEGGHLSLDYERLFADFAAGLPWANQIDLTASLSLEDYYYTDIHWRQEKLLKTAGVLCDALGVTAPRQEDYTLTALERPFYGVYYGQAALPMEPETMYLLESDLLKDCRVYDYESGKYTAVYNLEKLSSRDLYDVFLSGSRSLLTIENPHANTNRELVIFRDSFGSAVAPLLLTDYAKVTLVDLRYIQTDVLGRFLEFHDQDVLLLYSVPVLNNSQTIK